MIRRVIGAGLLFGVAVLGYWISVRSQIGHQIWVLERRIARSERSLLEARAARWQWKEFQTERRWLEITLEEFEKRLPTAHREFAEQAPTELTTALSVAELEVDVLRPLAPRTSDFLVEAGVVATVRGSVEALDRIVQRFTGPLPLPAEFAPKTDDVFAVVTEPADEELVGAWLTTEEPLWLLRSLALKRHSDGSFGGDLEIDLVAIRSVAGK